MLDCPPGSRFIVCIATDANDIECGEYYSNKASQIATDIRLSKGKCEYWKMCGRRYFICQARLDRSSHYSEIKIKSVSWHQFHELFENEGGDFALQFEGIATKLTIPWCDVINASKTIMLFGALFLQGHLFAKLFRKKKPKHAHHIFQQFSSEYYGDTRACAMLLIGYQQARLEAAAVVLDKTRGDQNKPAQAILSCLFDESSFNTPDVHQFQYFFDRYCEYAFVNCMNHYNHCSQPLIIPDDFVNYL